MFQGPESFSFNKRHLSKHLDKFEENYLRKFKLLVQDKVKKHFHLLQKRIIYPEQSLMTLEANFPYQPGQVGNLPLNYVEDIIAPTQKNFLMLKESLEEKRKKLIKDMAKRVQKHFEWIDPKILKNRIVWTGLRTYLYKQGFSNVNQFEPFEFEKFLEFIFKGEGYGTLLSRF